jgi:hypothetical protein
VAGQDGSYYRLNVGTAGNQFAGSFVAYSEAASLPNAGKSDSGMVSLTATSSGLTGTLTDPSGNTEAATLDFDNVYNTASSLPMLSGTWTYNDGGFSLSAMIQADGTLSGTDSNNCTYSGALGLLDANFDIYSARYVRSCNSVELTFTGLASYFPATGTAAPAEIKLLTDDGVGDYLVADLE